MTKHTPGPWQVYHWDTHSDAFDGSDEHESPYVLETSKEVDLLDEHDANARLMEAAPDLLAALEQLVERVDWLAQIDANPDWQPIDGTPMRLVKANDIDYARDAIVKARGE